MRSVHAIQQEKVVLFCKGDDGLIHDAARHAHKSVLHLLAEDHFFHRVQAMFPQLFHQRGDGAFEGSTCYSSPHQRVCPKPGLSSSPHGRAPRSKKGLHHPYQIIGPIPLRLPGILRGKDPCVRLLLRVKEDFGAIDYTRRHRQPSIDGCRRTHPCYSQCVRQSD